MLFKYIIYFLFFFGLLYSENFELMGISFSQLWKMPLVVFLIIHFSKNIKSRKPAFQNFSLLYAIKMIFNTNLSYRPFSNFVECARFLPLPLLYEYFRKKSITSIGLWLTFLSQFAILSSIPFHIGLLESAGKQVSLQGFGFADLYGHTGIFQGAHAASVTYTIAVIILINKLFLPVAKKNYFYDNRFYNVILIAIGTYSIFAGFVRTGYLMFLVSILVFVFSWFKFTPKQLFTIAATIFLLFVGIFYLIQTNDVFSARLFDQRVYGSSSIGSGRLIFWKNAYECWSNGNALEMLFGIGIDNFKNYQYEKIGLKIFSHSQFFDSLVQNGIFGILLYLFMLSALFSFIRKRKRYVGYSLALSLFSAYLMFALVQGSSLFFPDLMFALSLAYLFSSSQHSCLIVSHKL